jgi:hypothetical protein
LAYRKKELKNKENSSASIPHHPITRIIPKKKLVKMVNFCVPTILTLIPIFMLFIVGGSAAGGLKMPAFLKKLYSPNKSPARLHADYKEPSELYKNCNDLSISNLFEQMIIKLQGQIPLPYYNWGIKGADKYYTFVLTKITNVMNEIDKQKVLEKNGNDEQAKTFLHGTHAVSENLYLIHHISIIILT